MLVGDGDTGQVGKNGRYEVKGNQRGGGEGYFYHGVFFMELLKV